MEEKEQVGQLPTAQPVPSLLSRMRKWETAKVYVGEVFDENSPKCIFQLRTMPWHFVCEARRSVFRQNKARLIRGIPCSISQIYPWQRRHRFCPCGKPSVISPDPWMSPKILAGAQTSTTAGCESINYKEANEKMH